MKVSEMAKVEAKSTTIYTGEGMELAITKQCIRCKFYLWRASLTTEAGEIRDNFYEEPTEEALNNFLSFAETKLNK